LADDASSVATGSVLLQEVDGIEHPICYYSKKLDGHQKNYSTVKKVWREPANHVTDCYFCAVDVTGINRKNRSNLKYPDLESARHPVAHLMKFQYLFLENLLTFVTKIPPVFQKVMKKGK